MIKYKVKFKHDDGSHMTTRTMSPKEYQEFLLAIINYLLSAEGLTNPYPSVFFEVVKETETFKTPNL